MSHSFPERNGGLPEPSGTEGGLRPSFWARAWAAYRESAWPAGVLRSSAYVIGIVTIALVGRVAAAEAPKTIPIPDGGSRDEPGMAHVSEPKTAPGSATAPAPAPCAVTAAPTLGAAPTATAPSARTAEGKLILNLATAADLDRLPGVGAKRAEEVIALRQRLGRFRRLQDLLRVRGIGPKTLQKWAELVVVDAPIQPPVP